MRHRAPIPHVAMEPEPAGHGIDHSFSPFLELAPRGREAILLAATYWQPMRPSTVAGGVGATLPKKMPHVSGYAAG